MTVTELVMIESGRGQASRPGNPLIYMYMCACRYNSIIIIIVLSMVKFECTYVAIYVHKLL